MMSARPDISARVLDSHTLFGPPANLSPAVTAFFTLYGVTPVRFYSSKIKVRTARGAYLDIFLGYNAAMDTLVPNVQDWLRAMKGADEFLEATS